MLVIKHGALGDFVLATGPFAAIRRHHPHARIVLLTTAAFAGLAAAAPWFDEVWIDRRPGWTRPLAWLALRRRLLAGGFGRVYDLQTSARSSLYFRLLPRPGRPQWSGIAPGCALPHVNPLRDSMHSVERQAEQLAQAGLAPPPPPSLDWLTGDIAGLPLPARYALLVPGGSPERPGKRWPAAAYGELAKALSEDGLPAALIGTLAEADAIWTIKRAAPSAIDLSGRTDFGQIAALARRAVLAVGNDTGPMHVIATAGCPSLILFGSESDPALCAPRGPLVRILRHQPLRALGVPEVLAAARALAPVDKG